MRRDMILAAFVLFPALPAAANAPARPEADPGLLCRQAIQAAEREHRLPAALLHAIARVESGRADPRTGKVTPWPWTVNAEGEGRYFDSKPEAIAAVQALQARGVRYIDVGCLQVNLHYHGQAFASLEEAFDPPANARYAAQFLTRLYQGPRNWEQAASRYHSSTPELADAYRLKVLAAWPAGAHRLAAERQRQALVAAWGGSGAAPPRQARGNGFQAMALILAGRPSWRLADEAVTHGRGRLDPAPVRAARRPAPPRRGPLVELAEAPARR
jgi:hypothetical protein